MQAKKELTYRQSEDCNQGLFKKVKLWLVVLIVAIVTINFLQGIEPVFATELRCEKSMVGGTIVLKTKPGDDYCWVDEPYRDSTLVANNYDWKVDIYDLETGASMRSCSRQFDIELRPTKSGDRVKIEWNRNDGRYNQLSGRRECGV